MISNLQKIATLAADDRYNIKKAGVFGRIEKIAQEGDNTISDVDLAALYRYFMPSYNAKNAKTDMAWVSLATSKDAVRYYLNNIYSTGDMVCATDGHRLHIWDVKKDKGFYNKEGVKIEVDANFPDITRVIPECENAIQIADIADCEVIITPAKVKVVNLFDDVWFSYKYVMEALQKTTSFEVKYNGGMAVISIAGDRRVVIMQVKF